MTPKPLIKPVTDPQTEDNAPDSNPQPFMRLGVLFILVGFVGFLLWAVLAPLDAGVTASGTVGVESKRKTIQHLNGGIIQDILVKDGDAVKSGDVLIRLERIQIEAQQQITHSQLVSAKALELRLLAERLGKPSPDFETSPILQEKTTPIVKEAIETQSALFKTRRQALDGQLSILDTTVDGLQQQLEGLLSQKRSKTEQAKLLNEELAALRPLYKKGYVPRNRIFELERAAAEVSSQHSGNVADIGRVHSALNETKLKKLQLTQEFHKEVETHLAEAQRDTANLSEKFAALNDELARTEIRAMTDGIVVGLNFHTNGGVIRPGDPILELVPQSDPLIIEAHIMPHLIEQVTKGQPALVRFVALDRVNPVVEGITTGVSADILIDKNTGQPYYAARISVPPAEMLKLKYERVNPGMPVDVVIKTGERSMLEYLLRPLMESVFMALRER